MEQKHIYIAIDLKSFYASVECRERDLNPLTANLVVADISRTEKTICLAVSPSLKSFGIPGRARLFEVLQKVREVNNARRKAIFGREFTGKSSNFNELQNNKELELDFIIAPPQMALYMQKSAQIYSIYLKYVAEEDIHSYSVDEVFIDATKYLKLYKMSARQFAMVMIKDVLATTGITATAGIGTNLYLAKIAMDILAKHIPADENGVRIAALDEKMYREKMWEHVPISDFWRVGKGYAKKLQANHLYTMGDIARCSLGGKHDFFNQELLYKLFGVNAELLIDHAWGYEPVTLKDVKSYKPEEKSVGAGQVLSCPYNYDKAKLIVKEMADLLVLDLVDKGLVTNQIVLTLGYDKDNITESYEGEITEDRYGRKIPKHGHGSINLGGYSSSTELILAKTEELFDKIAHRNLLVRRANIVANHVIPEEAAIRIENNKVEELDLFADLETMEKEKRTAKAKLQREKRRQEAILEIQKEFGKNAILKGMNYEEGAKTKERNRTIGGHKAYGEEEK